MRASSDKIRTYAASICIALAVGAIAAWVNAGSIVQPDRVHPPLSPPAWAFPTVWTILYILLGISAAKVWESDCAARHDALFLYAAQLVVGLLWTVFFFSFQAYLLAFFWMVFLLLLVALMLRRFLGCVPETGKLLIPYAIWLLFATYLNLGVWVLNR